MALVFVGSIMHPLVSPAEAAIAIGGTERVVSEVNSFLGEITRVLEVADEVFTDEIIQTSDDGATRIVFVDGTELTMGPRSRVTLDHYVYDPASGQGAMAVRFVSGIFEFASGLLPSANYDLRTPFANLAIRGTRIRMLVREDGMQVTVPEGQVEIFSGPVSLDLEGATSCIVWEDGVAELRPLDEACSEMAGAQPSFLGEITDVRRMPDEITIEEMVETGAESGLRLVFTDDTEIALGVNSRVTVERYAFDPVTGEGSLAARFGAGAFEFTSGRLPSAAYDLQSPFSKVEVRGTIGRVLVRDTGKKVTVPEGAIRLVRAGTSLSLDSATNCLVIDARGGGETGPIEVLCGALMSDLLVMAGLLGSPLGEIEPGAGPDPAVIPGNFFPPVIRDRTTLQPVLPVSVTSPQAIR